MPSFLLVAWPPSASGTACTKPVTTGTFGVLTTANGGGPGSSVGCSYALCRENDFILVGVELRLLSRKIGVDAVSILCKSSTGWKTMTYSANASAVLLPSGVRAPGSDSHSIGWTVTA